MLRLDSTLRKLQIVLGGAITTNQLPVVVCYSDKTTTAYSGGTAVSNTNSTTPVDICAAPAASTVRDIDSITVQNADTATVTATIRYNDNGTIYTLFKCVLTVGDQLIYTHGQGWKVLDSSGALKSLSSDVVTLTGTQTLTNKTIALGSNTISGTKAQFNAAVTDDDFAYIGQANTFTQNQVIQGRVGVGVATYNWTLGQSLDIGSAGVIGNGANSYFVSNQYYDGSWKYKANGFSSVLLQTNGNFDFYNSASGLADAVATQILRFRIDPNGNVLVISSASLGYGTGAGGTVTQATSRTTAVTLNKPTGEITLVSAAGSTSYQSFTVNNSLVTITSHPIVSQKSGTDLYEIHVTNIASGSFQITYRTTGGTTVESPVFRITIFAGATS